MPAKNTTKYSKMNRQITKAEPVPEDDNEVPKDLVQRIPGGEEVKALVHHMFPNLFFFSILLYRYVKKYSSSYTRAGLIALGISYFILRHLKKYVFKFVKEQFMCSISIDEGDPIYTIIMLVS